MSASSHALSGGQSGRPPLHPAGVPVRVAVRVAVRIRNESFAAGEQPFLTVHAEENAVSHAAANGEHTKATFDHVFPPVSSQSDVYAAVGPPLVHEVLNGKNATILAYGQTGAGKTHTMLGDVSTIDADARGIIPRALADVFDAIAADHAHEYTVTVSVLEMYGDKLNDLLSNNQRALKIRGVDRVYVESLSTLEVFDAAQALDVVRRGFQRRATSRTGMNHASSRSHAVCTVTLMRKMKNGSNADTSGVESLFTFVDLAGSERILKTQPTAQQRKEGIHINTSLLELTKVISAVSEKKNESVSYRGSKLTLLLKDALGGNSNTLFMACVSAHHNHAEETKCTLGHAGRAKRIKNAIQRRVDNVASSAPTSVTAPTSCDTCDRFRADLAAGRGSLVYAHEQLQRLDRLLYEEREKSAGLAKLLSARPAPPTMEQLNQDLRDKQLRISDLEDALSRERASHHSKIDALAKDVGEKEGKISDLEDALSRERASHHSKIDALAKDVGEKEGKISDLEDALSRERASHHSKIDALAKDVGEKEGKISDLEDALSRERASHHSKIDALAKDVGEKEGKISDLEDALSRERASHHSKIDALAKDVGEKEGKISDLEDALSRERASHHSKIDALAKDVGEKEGKISDLEDALSRERASHHSKIDALAKDVGEKEGKISDLEDALSRERASHHSKIDALAKDVGEKEGKISDLEDALSRERASHHSKIDALAKDVGEKEGKISDLEDALSRERASHHSKIDALAKDVGEKEAKINDLVKNVGELKCRVATLDGKDRERAKSMAELEQCLHKYLSNQTFLTKVQVQGKLDVTALNSNDCFEKAVMRAVETFFALGGSERDLDFLGKVPLMHLTSLRNNNTFK